MNAPRDDSILPAGASGPGEPSAGGQPSGAPTTAATRNDRIHRGARRIASRRSVAAAALVAVGVAAGAGIGHDVWHRTAASTPASAAQPGSSANAVGNGSGGFGSSGGYGAGFPAGSSGSGSTGFGGFPGASSGSAPEFGGSSSGESQTGGSSDSTATDGPTDAAAIAKDVDPGLVDITTTTSNGEAAGTGMVLTSTGEILTNNHVIDGATSIHVRDVGNGRTYIATVVGYDRTEDIAVLQLTGANGLTTVHTTTTAVKSGAAVVGIGNAGGTGGTPSYAGGAITATERTITASSDADGSSERLTGLLATDADIQAGDSGGPLVNTSGQVVGMDTAASSGYQFSGAGEGAATSAHGYAIPITTALTIARSIEAGDSSATVHIGATAKLGVYIDSDATQTRGAVVAKTQSGSPAAKAGVRAGDVITSIDGTTITTANQLSRAVTQLRPGQTVAITFTTSSGTTRSSRLTLASGAPQ